MNLVMQTNAWGSVVGHPVGVTSIKDLFYTAGGVSDRVLDEIADAGYRGIELFDGDLRAFEGDLAGFARRLSERGLELVGVYSGANFVFPDVLEDELWRIGVAADLAARVGAEHLVVGGGGVRSGGPVDDDWLRLAEGLDRVVAIAAAHGLTPSFHPHLGTIAQSPEQIERVFAHSRIGFCPDVAHLAAGGGDPAALIRRYAGRTPYVHLKDYRAEPFEFLPLGEGQIDMAGVLRALDEVGYDGWIAVELDGYRGDPKEGAIRSRGFIETHRIAAP